MKFSPKNNDLNNFDDKTVSLIILGDSKVGKTSILSMYTENIKRIQHIDTVGVDKVNFTY